MSKKMAGNLGGELEHNNSNSYNIMKDWSMVDDNKHANTDRGPV